MNEDQALAAEHLTGRVLVTAGAGSGKTRMLTERFANAVVPGRLAGWSPIDPSSVVAITFTEKAAGEIAERIRGEIESPRSPLDLRTTGDLWISTIHGFCSRILRRNPFEARVDPLFSVLDTLAAGHLREQAFRDALLQLDTVDSALRELLDVYSVDAVFSAVLEIERQLGAAGLGAEDVVIETAPSVDSLLHEAEALFDRGTSTCDLDYHGSSSGHLDHAEQCRTLLQRCSEIAGLDHTEAGMFGRILELAQSYKPMKKLNGFHNISDEGAAGKARLAAGAAAGMTHPHAQKLRELVGVYGRRYRELKSLAGAMDFEDLQTKAADLLARTPEIAARYRSQFKVVMVDEFQDTDILQLGIVERVAGENLCTVGDEMQAIYGFRGADVSVYREHRRAMLEGGALVAELATNYRSHPEILEFVNGVFASEQYSLNHTLALNPPPGDRPERSLEEVLKDGPRVEVLFVDSDGVSVGSARTREAAEIASRLAVLRDGGLDPGEVAVLVKAYTDAHIYAEALVARGIPAVVVGGGRFFALAETAVMRALTRVIANVADEEALGVLLASEFVPVADDALLQLRLEAPAESKRLWDLVCSDPEGLENADAQAFRRLREVVEDARARVGREPLEDVLLRAVEEAGYDLRLLARGNKGRDAFANVIKFARRAAEFERGEGSGPAGFSAHLDAKERLGDPEAPESADDDGIGAVRIMSIHASKGLEFPVVVVPDIGRSGRNNYEIIRTSIDQDRLLVALKTPKGEGESKSPQASEWFSRFDAADKTDRREESERVLYVALTRAQDLLMVSGSGGLNPARRSESDSDLVKLARALGHDVPIGEPFEESIVIGGKSAGRLRVVCADSIVDERHASACKPLDAPPPAYGAPLGTEQVRVWRPESVSYTQLSEFERCPRQFHIRRVLRVARPMSTGAGSKQPMRLGNALHAALRLVTPSGLAPERERLESVSRYFELSVEESGRLSESVAHYCDSEIATRVAGAQFVQHEAPFFVPVDDGLFILGGSIDLYARTDDNALIVDYKSGTSGESHELADRYRLQAECYAFAAMRDGCALAEVVFVRPEVLSAGRIEQVSFRFPAAEAEAIEARLLSRYRDIQKSRFAATPGAGCTTCDVPKGMCEFRSPR